MSLYKQLLRTTLLFVAVLSMLSCQDSDDDSVDPERDLFFFLEKTNPQFSADLNDRFILWQTFPLGDFSSNSSINFENNDAESSIKKLRYFMINEEERITIATPFYDTSSEEAIASVFGLGLKNIGAEDEAYNIQLERSGVIYDICEAGANYQLEVIKTEIDVSGSDEDSRIKVWFKLDDINLSDCEDTSGDNLNNGLFLARFTGYISE